MGSHTPHWKLVEQVKEVNRLEAERKRREQERRQAEHQKTIAAAAKAARDAMGRKR